MNPSLRLSILYQTAGNRKMGDRTRFEEPSARSDGDGKGVKKR